MRDIDLLYTYRLEENFWWFRGMRRITWSWIGDLKPQSILDAGCGTGFHLQWLRQRLGAGSVTGIDLSQTALDFTRRRQPDGPLARASITHLPFAGESFDLVTSFDVIVSLAPDSVAGALSEFHRVLRPGGHLFVRAAAFAWLYSSHDAELQTQARYSLPRLCALLSGAGFRVLRHSYANLFLFPIAAARRLLKRAGLFSGPDVRPMPAVLAPLEPLLLQALNLEAALLKARTRSLPFGLSAIVLAQKPGQDAAGSASQGG
ncbi:MAG: methyltransferase domain-containing protein [Acidobacteria bacterium]|nr:methyltransferase domain-containing protein [Acidobacteriota bacterium]